MALARAVAEAYPNDPLTYALLGSAYYNIGQSEAAARHLRRSLELLPNLVDVYEILARIAYDKGETEEAIRLCQEALKRGPGSPEILNRLGRAFIDLGKTDEAIRALEQAAGLPRASAESSYLLGQAYMQAGDFARAKGAFARVAERVPDHTQALFGLYTASQRLGQTNDAIRFRDQFQKLEAIDRKALAERRDQDDTATGLPAVRETTARTLFGAAQIYLAHKQTEKAGEIFRRCIALVSDNPAYRAALERFYVETKNLGEGLKVFEQLAREQPDNSLSHFFLGRLQSRLDQVDAADISFRKVQELAPAWAEGYRALAELYLRTNRKIDQARQLTEKAVDLEPSSANYYLLSVAAAKGNDRTAAINALQRAIALSPGEKRYQQALQQLEQSPRP